MNWTEHGGTPKAQCGLPSNHHYLLNRFPYATSPIEAFGSWRPRESIPVTSLSGGLLFDVTLARALATSPTSRYTQTQFELLSKSSRLAYLSHSQQLKQPTTPSQILQVPLEVAKEDLASRLEPDSPVHAFLRSKGGHLKKRARPGPIHRRLGHATSCCFPLPLSRNDQPRATVLKLPNMSRFAAKWRELVDGSTSSAERERKKAFLKEFFARRPPDFHETAACSRHPAKPHPT